MKVLYLTAFYPEIGGPFTALKTLLPVLARKGIKIKVLSVIPKNYPKEKTEFIYNLPFEVEYVNETLPRSVFSSFSLGLVRRIQKERLNFDLISLDGIFNFYAILTSLIPKPFILSNRGALMIEAYQKYKLKRLKKKLFLKVFGKKIIKKVSIIHLLTEEEKKHFLYFYPYAKSKIRIIPNGIDLKEFQNIPSKRDFLSRYPHLRGKNIILFLSRINWIKGLDILIPAFAHLYKQNKNVHLIIAGKDDRDGHQAKVEDWVRKYKLENSVTFTGFLKGVEKLMILANSDIFILPSYSENFGMAVVEAMACGTPVIISNKVAIYKEVKNHDAGVIVSPDIESVYKGLKRLLLDEDLRKKISFNGKEMVRRYYDIEKVADKMIEIYEEAIKSKKNLK